MSKWSAGTIVLPNAITMSIIIKSALVNVCCIKLILVDICAGVHAITAWTSVMIMSVWFIVECSASVIIFTNRLSVILKQ